MDLLKIYKNLYKHFGPQNWWPVSYSKTKQGKQFEIIVGAILTQNTAWKNAEKALKNLAQKKLLSIQAINKSRTNTIVRAIQPAGYYNQKAKKLKIFTKNIKKNYNGNLNNLLKLPINALRANLLSIWGIGEETADSIILYAASKPSFVIDAYTKRMCAYYSIQFQTYAEYKNLFESKLPKNTHIYNEFHALIVAWGKLESKKESKPLAKKLILLK